jgi:hypothetical protein
MTDPLRGFEELAEEYETYLREGRVASVDVVIRKMRKLITAARTEIRQGMRDEFVAGAMFTPLSGKPELWIDQVKESAARRNQ